MVEFKELFFQFLKHPSVCTALSVWHLNFFTFQYILTSCELVLVVAVVRQVERFLGVASEEASDWSANQ